MRDSSIDLKEYAKFVRKLVLRDKCKQINFSKTLDKLKNLKNIHKGKRCFIVRGSPSLKQLDLTKLNKEYVFTVNWGFKLREQGLTHSTYHVMTDYDTFEQDHVIASLPQNFCDMYLISAEINFPDDKFNTTYFRFDYKDLIKDIKYFETDATKPLAENRTIILIVLQIAFYMGFKEIYIIGVDLNFNQHKGHAYCETLGEKERQNLYSIKYEQEMYDGIAKATDIMNSFGVKVYNASPVGRLDCVQRVNYEDLFK